MSRRASDPESSFPRVSGYRIESVLGRGSMATVYKAVQVGMDRPVALKVLRDDVAEDPKTVRRLMREARLAARLNHPHVVRAHDAGVADDGACYFVMEYIEGASVRDILMRRGRFDEERAIDVAIEVAEALLAFYRQLIVHRDVKPANIMIDREGNALLADLGLAKIEFDSSMTSQNRAVGTPAYMSPEQARDPDNVDARTDIFSLGATLYHMVTGVSPFDAPTVGAVVTKILYDEPPPIRELDEDLSPELERIVTRMIAKDRSQRYETPGALLRDLRALRRGADLPTPPPPTSRRNQVLMAAVALVVIVVAGVLVFANRGDSDADDDRGAGGEQAATTKALDERDLTDLDAADAEMRREIERRLARALSTARARVDELLEREDFEAAEAYVASGAVRAIETELGGRRSLLREVHQERLEDALVDLRTTFDSAYSAHQSKLLDGAVKARRNVLRAIADEPHYVSRQEIEKRLAEVELPQLEKLDADSRAALARSLGDLAGELTSDWRERYESTLLEIRRLRDAHLFASARRAVASERERNPDELGAGFDDRLTAAEGRIDEAEQELQRTLLNRIARVDRIPDDGHRELSTRETAPLLAAIRETLERLPAEIEEAGRVVEQATLLRELEAVVADVHQLVFEIEAAEGVVVGAPVDFDTLDGEELRRVKVVSGLGDILRIRPGDGEEPVAYSTRRIAPASLLKLHGREASSSRLAMAFLHYCDDDFLAAEDVLAMARQTPAVRLLAERVSAAFAHFEKAASPESRAAVGVWRESRAAASRGDWAAAFAAARELVTDKALEKTEWYRLNRDAIREHYDRVSRLHRVSRAVAAKGGRWSVAADGLVAGVYSFDADGGERGLSLPRGYEVVQGRLRRAMRSESVAPDRTEAVTLALAWDLRSESADIGFRYHPSDREEFTPRCLTVSIGDLHVAFLGVLVGGGESVHMPLHGRERDVERRATFARVFSWKGDVAGYEAALRAVRSDKPAFRFESGTAYDVRIVIDPRTRRLTALVDGEVVHSRRLGEMPSTVDSMSIRAPMPHALDDLTVRGSVHIVD